MTYVIVIVLFSYHKEMSWNTNLVNSSLVTEKEEIDLKKSLQDHFQIATIKPNRER